MNRFESVYLATQHWAKNYGIPIESFKTLPSTNDLAKQEAFIHTSMCYLTQHQTQGRGQSGKTWLDTGQNLCVSFQFLMTQPPQPFFSPLIGLAAFKALDQSFKNLKLSIKPPNDIYLDDKKVGGLLIESVAKGHQYCLIVGFGLNVFSAPESIEQAGSLGLKQIDEDTWFEFLNLFYQAMNQIIYLGMDYLTPQNKEILLRALNAFPLQTKTYMDFTHTCQLETSEGMVSWRDFNANVTHLHTS